MAVRRPEEAPEYLARYLVDEVGGAVSCAVSSALARDPAALKAVIDAISRVLAQLRSGRAKKIGEIGPLQRILNLIDDVREQAGEAQALAQEVADLQRYLQPEALVEWGLAEVEAAVGGVAQEALRELLGVTREDCSGPVSAIQTASALSPVAAAAELAEGVVELARKAALLWNSNIDLPGLFDFDLIADELIDQLEAYLARLVRQSAGVGQGTALSFLAQRLVPQDWIVAVGGPPRTVDDD